MCDCPTQTLPLPIPHHHMFFWTACCFPCNRKLWVAFQQTAVKVSIIVFEITLVFMWGKVLPSRKSWTVFKNSTQQMVHMTNIYLNICLCVQLVSCLHQALNEKLVEYSTRQLQIHQTPELSVRILLSSSSIEEPLFRAVSTRFGQD